MAAVEKAVPPEYCQYAHDPCDQAFEGTERARALFFYPRPE